MSDFLSWLAGLDEDQLAVVLHHRPEVLHGSPPSDLAAVESRLSQPFGIARALVQQERPALQVLSALLVLGGRAPLTQCARTLDDSSPGAANHLDVVRLWFGRLERCALAWSDADEVLHAAPVVGTVLAVTVDWGEPARQLLEGYSKEALAPALRAWGLPRQTTKAATVAVLTEAFADPDRLAAQLELLTPAQRALLVHPDDADVDRIADERWFSAQTQAMQVALDAGLFFSPYAYSSYTGEAPTEVWLALFGRRLPFDPEPPPLPESERSAALVEQESQAALEQVNEAGLAVLDHVRGHPLAWLQNGGVGAREVNRVAKATKVDPALVRLVLDAVCEAGLLESDGRTLRWGDATEAWRDLDPGARVAVLLEHWLRTPRAPTQSHDQLGKSLAVGDPSRQCGLCREGRRTVLAEWSRTEQAVTDSGMAALVAWSRPLVHTVHREVVVERDPWDYRWRARRPTPRDLPPPLLMPQESHPDLGTVADEARLLGLVAGGAPTPLLRALLGDDRSALVSLAGAMLPSATGQATFGSDLTAVVVGPPTGELSSLLDSCADRESRGGAVTWRFSTGSVRRALDAGTTADDLLQALADIATSGLPQPLTYLVTDIGRRHGRVRVAAATAVVRSDDQGLLLEMTVDRKLRELGLRLVAPTVAVSNAGEAATLRALRAAGYLPMPERPDPTGDSTVPGGTPTRAAARSLQDSVDKVAASVFAALENRGGNVIDLRARARSRRAATEPEEDAATAATRLAGLRHAPGSTSADPRLVDALRHANHTLSTDEVATLAEAIVMERAVRIRYRSASAAVTERVVSDLEYSGHLLSGWCHLRGDERDFRVSEILSVAYP